MNKIGKSVLEQSIYEVGKGWQQPLKEGNQFEGVTISHLI